MAGQSRGAEVIDLVSSRAYPDLERSPGDNDNWVERVGGLPSYIERIAKHLHYEKGMSISRSIAVAVNTVKRWAAGGLVAEHGTMKRVNADTQAKAAAAVAEWEAKKARAKVDLSNATCTYCDAPPVKSVKTPAGGVVTVCAKHLSAAKARVANTKGPQKKGKVNDLSTPHDSVGAVSKDDTPTKRRIADLSEDELARLNSIIDLALTKDGRKSYKRQGKWGHGFVPLDDKAKKAKAKGSPIARKRINRLYGTASKTAKTSNAQNQHNAPINHKSSEDKKKQGTLRASESGTTERTSTGRVATSRRPFIASSSAKQRLSTAEKNQTEASKGGGRDARAFKPWNEVPEADKVVRNGKRYVKSVYRGQPQLVRWVGTAGDTATSDASKRKLASLSMRDALRMSTAQLRELLKVPGQPESVRKVLNSALREHSAKDKPEIKRF